MTPVGRDGRRLLLGKRRFDDPVTALIRAGFPVTVRRAPDGVVVAVVLP